MLPSSRLLMNHQPCQTLTENKINFSKVSSNHNAVRFEVIAVRRRRYLNIESTSVSPEAVAFGGGGVKLEVVNLQRLQTHWGAFWVMRMMNRADWYKLLQEILLYCSSGLTRLPHAHTHTSK